MTGKGRVDSEEVLQSIESFHINRIIYPSWNYWKIRSRENFISTSEIRKWKPNRKSVVYRFRNLFQDETGICVKSKRTDYKFSRYETVIFQSTAHLARREYRVLRDDEVGDCTMSQRWKTRRCASGRRRRIRLIGSGGLEGLRGNQHTFDTCPSRIFHFNDLRGSGIIRIHTSGSKCIHLTSLSRIPHHPEEKIAILCSGGLSDFWSTKSNVH